MNKEDLNKNTNYTYDAVAECGLTIFNEWKSNGVASRRIVSLVERSTRSMNQNRTVQSYVEALSYLYALDMRVREKYKNFIRCIFAYFSWKRETRALNSLRECLHIPKGGDIRQAIERGVENMREELEEKAADDKVGGGKTNRPSNEKNAEPEKKKDESLAEKENEKTADAVEDKKENANEKNEETATQKETGSDIKEQKSSEKGLEESKALENRADALKPEEKEKIGGADAEFKQVEDNKAKENNAYNKEIDYAPLPEHIYNDGVFLGVDDLVREIIPDNTPSNKGEPLGNEPQGEERKEEITTDSRNDVFDSNRSGERLESAEKTEKFEKTSVNIKNEHSDKEMRDTKPSEDKAADNASKESREAIQVELSEDAENEMRRQINDDLTVEQIIAIKQGMEEEMREKICIEETIFNAEENLKQSFKGEPTQIKSETKQSNMFDRR